MVQAFLTEFHWFKRPLGPFVIVYISLETNIIQVFSILKL